MDILKNRMNIFKLMMILLVLPLMTMQAQTDETAAPRLQKSQAQFVNVPKELPTRIEKFFSILHENSVQKAFDALLEGSLLKNREEQVAKLVEQTKQAIVLYGKSENGEPVSSEVATPSLIRLRYIGLNQNFPMRWIFTFYNSPRFGWMVVDVKLDDMSEYFFTDE